MRYIKIKFAFIILGSATTFACKEQMASTRVTKSCHHCCVSKKTGVLDQEDTEGIIRYRYIPGI